jgi:hypothetical protein
LPPDARARRADEKHDDPARHDCVPSSKGGGWHFWDVRLALMSTRPSSFFFPAKDVLEPHNVASNHLA